jgi:hypothetical protein
MSAVALMFQCIVNQVGGSSCKNRGCGFKFYPVEVLDKVVVDYLDDFGNLVSGIEILGNDRPTESGTLVGDKFALYVATGNGSDDNSAFFYDKRGVSESSVGVVVQKSPSL